MKKTKLKMSGFWFNLYRLNYGKKNELAEDTCSLKRGIIFSTITAIILLPLLALRMTYRLILKIPKIIEWNWKPIHGLVGYIPPFLVIVMPTLFGSAIFSEPESITWALIWITGLGVMILAIVICGILGFGSVFGYESIVNYRTRKRNELRVESGDFDAILPSESFYKRLKDKFCSKIEWIK